MKTDKHWERIGRGNHHGIVLPLFSLWSKKNENGFLSLIPMIDWCAGLGFDVLQLLPINDCGDDPSPYSAISSCALDPRYLTLSEPLQDHFLKNFNSEDPAYKFFYDENAVWLHPYARFKSLKEMNQGRPWNKWTKTDALDIESINFHCFNQFLCFQQMKKVREYAARRKVFLMGDIPILVNRDSADVWANPTYFNIKIEAGAPPDNFDPKGQRWGVPLFAWDVMSAMNYEWWKMRLNVSAQIFDLYRIDHVVGFFRIWGIREQEDGTVVEGFIPTDKNIWPKQGREILEMMLDACPMLPIAEDLGGKVEGIDTLKTFVRPMLKEFGICGTKVLRWERRWDEDLSYIPYSEYEVYSLSTVSTHDTETLQQWWKNQTLDARAFCKFKNWTYEPDLSLQWREEILRDSHHTPSYFHINLLQEYLSLFPELSWDNPNHDRINVPGTVSSKNWSFKFKPSLEEIIEHEKLKESMIKMSTPSVSDR